MPLTHFPASIDVTTFTGSNGFAINGFPYGSDAGSSVSSAGDINADGIEDLVIGAPNAVTSTTNGIIYVIFGQSRIGGSGTLSVSSLTGSHGFVINGFPLGNQIGYSVSSAGDINSDGIADLVIGASYVASNSGICYVIFGASNIGSGGTLSVSSLTGSHGFAINGFPASSKGGFSVSAAGDINNDGIADLVIGAPYAFNNVGATYVIFGNKGIGASGSLDVSSLTGANGFAITGFPIGTSLYAWGGYSVFGGGDVNADGIADLVIGAPYTSSFTGASYVIFGQKGIGGSGTLNIASLTGRTGFTITGYPASRAGGYSVNGVKDLNGDGVADLIISAPFGSLATCYVIFGHIGIGSSGSVSVSSLTGMNGFSIIGFPKGSQLQGGFSVSGVGDLNTDGIADLVISAPYSSRGVSTCYAIFGAKSIGVNGTLDVSSLIGSNGFVITGFPVPGGDVVSVRGAGDINNDGIADLVVGAPQAFGTGVSYVIFGDGITNLLSNQLTITKGHTVIISNANLNATSIKFQHRNPNLIFTISDAKWGHFEQVGHPGIALSQFMQAQVSAGQIQFVDDDSMQAPSYSVSVSDGGYASIFPPQAANITYIHRGALLVKNTLAINQGETLIISSTYLNAINQDNLEDTPRVIFSISNVLHGQFESIYYPGVAIISFTQGQIQSNSIQFVQDGSVNAPSYHVQVSDGVGGIITKPKAAIIRFNLPPILLKNSFSINQGQALTLSSVNLSASDPDDPASSLVFSANNIQHGHFELINNPGTIITSFTQGQVLSSNVQFIPDGSMSVPSFTITVSDGKVTLPSVVAIIKFNLAPIIRNNALTVKQGETVVLIPANLSATDPDDPASGLIFIVSNVKHGRFELKSAPGSAITNFSQAEVQTGSVQFVHDGSPNRPSYSVQVSDGKITTPSEAAVVNFAAAPILTSNQLTIAQGQSLTITRHDLSATDEEVAPGELVFTAVAVNHGQFEESSNPGIGISQFSQQMIFNAALKFVSDGGPLAPNYNMSVSDGSLSSTPVPAIINFLPDVNIVSSRNTTRDIITGVVISGSIGLFFLAAKIGLTYKANQYMSKIFGDKSGSEVPLTKFHQKIIKPLAKKIFKHIKTTGFLGYRSEADTKAYIAAIETLVDQLEAAGINLSEETLGTGSRNRFFNIIADEIRQLFVPHYKFCSTNYIYSFFKVEVTPKQIEDKAEMIAAMVASALKMGDDDTLSSCSLIVETPQSHMSAGIENIELSETNLREVEEGTKTDTKTESLSERAKILLKQMETVDDRSVALELRFSKIKINKKFLSEGEDVKMGQSKCKSLESCAL